ncbi:MAG TPA: bifunctional riboflavin kinase/FAD synthetase [Burkholderiaceae bacterium]|nr:bifunctional riboflavin kinase/FAD synthetase [Burkholderiaceae bacterium]
MHLHRGLTSPAARALARTGTALTIGNFDGVHRGHQAMLALLRNEASHRGVPSCVLTFEPHPRDFFARLAGKPELAPARIATLRDKLGELERCGIDHVVLLKFDARLAALAPEVFIEDVLARGLGARYVLVGDDFRFGAKRAGDYATLDAAGASRGFDVARMMSYEVHGQRVSSSAVREALAAGDLALTASLLGRPYAVSGRVAHGRKLGRRLGERAPGAGDGFRTLNLRMPEARPAAAGIFVSRVFGLAERPLPAVSSIGVRPTVEQAGRILLETHCLAWPATLGAEAAYGRVITVELLRWLHAERDYGSLPALHEGIARDVAEARAWFDVTGVNP